MNKCERNPLPSGMGSANALRYTGVECIQITEHMGFNIGNTIKYLWRAGLKDRQAELQDLEKAKWYLQREIDRQKKLQDAPLAQ